MKYQKRNNLLLFFYLRKHPKVDMQSKMADPVGGSKKQTLGNKVTIIEMHGSFGWILRAFDSLEFRIMVSTDHADSVESFMVLLFVYRIAHVVFTKWRNGDR